MTFGNFGHTGCPSPPASTGAVCGTSSYCDFPIFFWVDTGGNGKVFTITYTYTLNGEPYQASADLSFGVTGPTGNLLPNAFVQKDNSATGIFDQNLLPNPQANPAVLAMTNAPLMPGAGIWFNDNATLPRGQFIWVQVINFTNYSQLFQAGTGYTVPTNLGLGLDGIYPYPSGGPNSPSILTSDAPGRADLYGFLGEAAESFDATMYVLWDPSIPQGCIPAWTDVAAKPYTSHASTCTSIPVPLASVHWTWKACSINALAPIAGGGFTPSWLVQCGPGNYDQAVASSYPTWSSCDASANADCHH